MINLLFVDDEPLILRTLERALRPEREWKLRTSTSGDEALNVLAVEQIDIVVSDVKMPGMDGLTFLESVRDRFPGVIRFVLSGHATGENGLRAASVAHQFLAKPCDTTTLRSTIRNVFAAESRLGSRDAMGVLAALRSIPLPRIFGTLTAALADETVGLRQVAGLIEKEVSVAAKVLQVVNGAFFGLGQTVTSIERAVLLLGVTILRALVLSQELWRAFPIAQQSAAQKLQDQALRTAMLARRFADSRDEGEMAFTAGLLHDVGHLILLDMEGRPGVARTEPLPDHAALGAALLALWGLPAEIVDAVAYHHRPGDAPEHARRLTALVHAATSLQTEALGIPDECPLNEKVLEDLGMNGSLPRWRELAHEAA